MDAQGITDRETRAAIENRLLLLLRKVPNWEDMYSNTSRVPLPVEDIGEQSDALIVKHLEGVREVRVS